MSETLNNIKRSNRVIKDNLLHKVAAYQVLNILTTHSANIINSLNPVVKFIL